MSRIDPLLGSRFRLEIDDITIAGFSEVVLGGAVTEVVSYREGTDPPHARKLAGLTRYGNVILSKGLAAGADALDLYQWFASVSSGGIADKRKRVVVVVQDAAGTDQARFAVRQAWPLRYEASPLNALAAQVVIETLELAHEGLERLA